MFHMILEKILYMRIFRTYMKMNIKIPFIWDIEQIYGITNAICLCIEACRKTLHTREATIV